MTREDDPVGKGSLPAAISPDKDDPVGTDSLPAAISPLDGRYAARLRPLGEYFSEQALMAARCRIELLYVLEMDRTGLWPPLTPPERERIEASLDGFGSVAFARIKAIEETTRHDVKACERFLRERLALVQPDRIHFGLTSEDVNNLAYTTLLRDYRDTHQLPLLRQLIEALCALVRRWRSVPMPARTHGQPASPTTAGKEMAVFAARLLRQFTALRRIRFSGKINGATGTFAAFKVAFPDTDWLEFSRRFVSSLGLEPSLWTTQVEDHDTWAEYFNRVRQVANITIDLDRDLWQYIAFGYLVERPRDKEVGSSTMPHKVNPIHFENSEGNLELAVALLGLLSDKLCRSRMQRDLSDSTVERNIGVALGHVHLALDETVMGLSRLDVDGDRCRRELEACPELLAEPMQTLLRTAGVAGIVDPYEQLRRLTRGRPVALEELHDFVDRLEVDDHLKRRLRSLTVTGYVGEAPRLCDLFLEQAERELAS